MESTLSTKANSVGSGLSIVKIQTIIRIGGKSRRTGLAEGDSGSRQSDPDSPEWGKTRLSNGSSSRCRTTVAFLSRPSSRNSSRPIRRRIYSGPSSGGYRSDVRIGSSEPIFSHRQRHTGPSRMTIVIEFYLHFFWNAKASVAMW